MWSMRDAINSAAARFFGAAVTIDERVYEALAVETSKGGPPHETHVWANLSRVLPSMSLVYETIGAELPETPKNWPTHHRPLAEWWSTALNPNWWNTTFDRLFGVRTPDRMREFTAGAKIVIATKHLGVEQLARSILEAGGYTRSTRERRTNAVARPLAAARGVPNPERWSNEHERLIAAVEEAFANLRISDSSLGAQQYVLSLDGNAVRLQAFGSFGAYQLSDLQLPDGSLWVARSNVLQPSTVFHGEALAELEGLITSAAPEAVFQRFFERNDEFLLALGDYSRLHPQLILHEDDGGRLIPDFFLERIDSDCCDICDLKLPTADLVRQQHHRGRFRDAVMEGVAQLSVYRDWFDDRAHRQAFRERYGLTAFRPRVVLVIGRRHSFYDDIERIRLESSLPGYVQLKTYDDIVARARQWRLFAGRVTRHDASA